MEAKSPDIEPQKSADRYPTIYSDLPYKGASFDEETIDAITDGNKFLIVSDESVEVAGTKRPKLVNRRLYEYISGGVMTHSFSYNEADGMFVATARDSENELTVVYEGRYFSQMKEALGSYALSADALKAA